MHAACNWLWYHWKRNSWLLYPPRFLTDYCRVIIDRPIFLVGNQGGGLTLVSRMLRRHTDVVSISGGSDYWTGADEMQKVMMLRLPARLRLGGRYLRPDQRHEQLTPPRSWSYASDDLIDAYRSTEEDYAEDAARTLERIIREALHRFGNGGTSKRFVDKSQVLTVKMSYVDALLRDHDPHFVLVSRNPYAACYRAALGKAGDMRRYARYMSLDERMTVCVQHWSNAMQCVLEDRETVSNFHHVRFEDILKLPETRLSELCDFLGLCFQKDMVPQAHHHVPFGSKYSDRWYPLRSEVNQQYLDEIPSKYVHMVKNRCGEIAEAFGYFPPR